MRLRMAVFAGGCAISLYVAVVAQLVWGDRGVSATLGGSRRRTVGMENSSPGWVGLRCTACGCDVPALALFGAV